LNEAFNFASSDSIKICDIFKDVAGNVGLEFRLASNDPLGNPTNGIKRKKTSVYQFNVQAVNRESIKSEMYGSKAWDTDFYLNIWMCNLSGLYGFAYPPPQAKFWGSVYYEAKGLQGTVLDVIATDSTSSVGSLDAVITHEAGHFFGLRHIWRDGNYYVDDFIDDTPLASFPRTDYRSRCAFDKNSCQSESVSEDEPNMAENFMDYSLSLSSCQCMFTKQQSRVMLNGVTKLRTPLIACTLTGKDEDSIPLYGSQPSVNVSWWPNPNDGILAIRFDREAIDYSINIVTLEGKVAEQYSLSKQEMQTISLENLVNGMYYSY
jgi:hypothetical protein